MNNSSVTSQKKLLTAITGTFLILLGLVVVINYYMNPMIYRAAYMGDMAVAMQEGKNIAIYDPNINWRALRREQIENLKTTPEIVVSGGSRWQEAAESHVPGKAFFNAHGHSDYAEDFFAIVHLLEKNDRMPDTLVLSLRYRIFEPIELRTHTGWREWVPEYRAMYEKLGLEPAPYSMTNKSEHWWALFSLSNAWNSLKRSVSAEEHPGPTDSATLETLDVIVHDGSLRWSNQNQIRFSPEYAEKDAQKRLDRFRDFDLKVDEDLIHATEKLLEYLDSKDVSVVLAQTPFHPTFYDGISSTQFGQTLNRIQTIGDNLAEKYGIQVVGSFNPHELGCPKREFIDWHHGTPKCLGNVFQQIKFED